MWPGGRFPSLLLAADRLAALRRRATDQLPMTDDNNTTAGLDQADEEILTYTVSDEALEAVAGTEGGE